MKDVCKKCGVVYDETEYMQLASYVNPYHPKNFNNHNLCLKCYEKEFGDQLRMIGRLRKSLEIRRSHRIVEHTAMK